MDECETFTEFCASHTCNIYGEVESSCPLAKFQQPNKRPSENARAYQKPSEYLSRVNLECEKEFNRLKRERE